MSLPASILLDSLTRAELEGLLELNPSLKSFLLGYIAEHHLQNHLTSVEGISEVQKIRDKDKQRGDFQFQFQGRRHTVELKTASVSKAKSHIMESYPLCESVIKRTDKEVLPDSSTTTCLPRGEFDVLALCTFPIVGIWEFWFIHQDFLPSSKEHPDRIISRFQFNPIVTPCLHLDIRRAIKD